MIKAAQDSTVAGFKSIACYRTGLDVSPDNCPLDDIEEALMGVMRRFQDDRHLRLADKIFNDYLVRIVMKVAGEYNKPSTCTYFFFNTAVQTFYSPVPHGSWRF